MKKLLKVLPFAIIASGIAYVIYADKKINRILG